MTFAERLKELRTEKHLSMDDVGNFIGVGRANIYKYERGMITSIPPEKIQKLAVLFGVTRSYLMGWTDDRTSETEEEEEPASDRIHTQAERKVMQGLAMCTGGNLCEACPYDWEERCIDRLMKDALSLVNEWKAMQPKKYPPSRYSDSTFGCRACGHELAPGRPKFCHECGRPVKWDDVK